MLTLFIDESGCPGQLRTLNSAVQPLLVIVGIALDTSQVAEVTRKFARLTQRYHHGQSRPNEICTDIQAELVKGSDVRRAIRANPISNEIRELALLDSVLSLMKSYRARLFGTVVVKRVEYEFDGQMVYGRALHEVVRGFHEELVASSTLGTAIADFREAKLNGRVSTELMAAKLGPTGDQLSNLVHLPTFGNSEVHAPLQIADLICSAIVWPIAAHQFRDELKGSPLLSPVADEATWRRFRQRLQEMIPPLEFKPDAALHPQEIGGHRAIAIGRLLQKRAPAVVCGARAATEVRRCVTASVACADASACAANRCPSRSARADRVFPRPSSDE